MIQDPTVNQHQHMIFIVISKPSFCCSKKVRKLHLFSTKVTFTRTFDCERLDTTYFRLRGFGQKPRFSTLPPLIEFGQCRSLLGWGCKTSSLQTNCFVIDSIETQLIRH